MGSAVHGQAASTATESVSLGSVFAAVAVLAEQHSFVLTAVCGIQSLVAHAWRGERSQWLKKDHQEKG